MPPNECAIANQIQGVLFYVPRAIITDPKYILLTVYTVKRPMLTGTCGFGNV
jgi:hypothetical protein